jgi:cell division protein FtsB
LKRKRQTKRQNQPRRLLTSGRVAAALMLAASVWIAYGFSQKMYISYKLNAQVTQLQRENARIADANRGYSEQLASISRPGAAEELARQHNYARPDEKVYAIIVPSPNPSPSTSPKIVGANTGGAQKQPSFWDFVWFTVTSPFRK